MWKIVTQKMFKELYEEIIDKKDKEGTLSL